MALSRAAMHLSRSLLPLSWWAMPVNLDEAITEPWTFK